MRQNRKAAVVHHEMESPRSLSRAPADPLLIARFKMQCRCTEANERDPLPVEFGDVTQSLPREPCVLKIVPLFEKLVEFRPFLLNYDPDGNSL